MTPDPVYISSTSVKPLGWVGLGQAHNVFQPPIKVDTNGPCLAFLLGQGKNKQTVQLLLCRVITDSVLTD